MNDTCCFACDFIVSSMFVYWCFCRLILLALVEKPSITLQKSSKQNMHIKPSHVSWTSCYRLEWCFLASVYAKQWWALSVLMFWKLYFRLRWPVQIQIDYLNWLSVILDQFSKFVSVLHGCGCSCVLRVKWWWSSICSCCVNINHIDRCSLEWTFVQKAFRCCLAAEVFAFVL